MDDAYVIGDHTKFFGKHIDKGITVAGFFNE